jgi:hypothetical protein
VSPNAGAGLRPSLDAWIAVALGIVLLLLGFLTTGGFDGSVSVSAANTWTEIVIVVLGAGALCALVVLGVRVPRWGTATMLLFGGLTALTALSIIWSVVPDDSWQAANLTLSYLMTFTGGAVLARVVPERWRALVAAVAVVAVLLSGYALLAKVFPGSLAAGDTEGRLQAPLGYWNATGALAAMGIGPCLWGFSRPDGPRLLRAIAAPGGTLLASAVVLSFSRTSLGTAVVVLILWLALAPGRLRSVLLIAISGVGSAIVCAWSIAHAALSTDGATLAARTSQGHTFGIVLLLVVLGELAAGLVAMRIVDRAELRDPRRRQIGIALIGLAALVPVAAIIALAASSRGLTGQITHGWQSLTSVSGGVGESSSRLTQFGSSRPLYWSQGISVGEHHVFKGVGALGYATARTLYTDNMATAGHAHSYVIQTFADLGLLGLVTTLALFVAWLVASGRTLVPRVGWSRLVAAGSHERSGLFALWLFVFAFGVSSAFDWTWYFPAVTLPALFGAGWLAARGPVTGPVAPRRPRAELLSRPGALAGCSTILIVSLVCAWLIWQPLRSANDVSAAFTAASTSAAFDDARSAQAANPLALEPLFVLSQLYSGQAQTAAKGGDHAAAGRLAATARGKLLDAVRLQPRNFESWLALGDYDGSQGRPRLALREIERAYALDPVTPPTIQALAQAQQAARGH